MVYLPSFAYPLHIVCVCVCDNYFKTNHLWVVTDNIKAPFCLTLTILMEQVFEHSPLREPGLIILLSIKYSMFRTVAVNKKEKVLFSEPAKTQLLY